MGYKYDIALSFATEEQQLVDKVYHYLKREGMTVFLHQHQSVRLI